MTTPAVILVRPQLGENIGAAARAMANFGLSDLRIVAPRDGWPNPAAEAMAAGACSILDDARLCASASEAIGDLHRVWATSARRRDMLKPDVTPAQAAVAIHAWGETVSCGVMFGPERSGLDNDEVALADALVHIPTAPAHTSLNLAQAVLVIGYEWHRIRTDETGTPPADPAGLASRAEIQGLLDHLIDELDDCGFLRDRERRPIMVRNIGNMFTRAGLFEQEVRTLRGIVSCLAHGRRR